MTKMCILSSYPLTITLNLDNTSSLVKNVRLQNITIIIIVINNINIAPNTKVSKGLKTKQ